MEEKMIRVLLVVMVLMMVMVVETQAQTFSQSQDSESQLLDLDVHPTGSTRKCLKKCGIKCGLSIIKPPAFAICFATCMGACKFFPSQALTSCTANCANSMLLAYGPVADSEGDSEGTGDEKVGDYVASCFQSCQGN